MDLNILWFIIITTLFAGFFLLEGFDYGVGTLLPFVSKNDTERRVLLNTIGPFWDGNEVWLLTAGGAIFAAFPHWYATLFSGFYLALFLVLIALIIRGVAIDFRSKVDNAKWRKTWDILFVVGSFLPALLFGVAVSNLMAGVPIDTNMEYAGTFFTLLNPFALLGGLVTLFLFTYHGSLFLSLKSGVKEINERVSNVSKKVSIITLTLTVLWVIYAMFHTNLISNGIVPIIAVVIAALCLILSMLFNFKNNHKKAFICSCIAIVFVTITVFATMFPNVMISTLDPANSLTIYNASSSPYTLKIMSIVGLTILPIVICYQCWNFWIFRKRITKNDLHY